MRTFWSLVAMVVVTASMLSFTSALRADDANKEKQPAKGTLKVTVNGEDGKPVEGATVTLTVRRARNQQNPPAQQQAAAPGDNNGNGGADNGNGNTARRRNPPVAKGTTDASGVCTLSDVPVGDYNLNARKTDVGTTRKRVTIKEGNNDAVTVELKKTAARQPAKQAQ